MVIRPKERGDLPALWRLHQKTGLSPYQESDFTAWIDNHACSVALSPENKMMGFLVLQDNIDHRDLLLLTVDPLYRRQGIARALMHTILTPENPLLLEVEETNTAAVALYHSLDFHIIGQRRDYYGPKRHAVVMRWG
jgi:ribosomal-protein-alanine N-acetyltransferase